MNAKLRAEGSEAQKKEESLRPLYARSFVNQLGLGMVSPFVSAYAVDLGASSSDMGWFQSSSNISNNILQVFWGKLSDSTGRRTPFIALGTVALSLLWIPMIFVSNATQLIIILSIQALVGSMATPALDCPDRRPSTLIKTWACKRERQPVVFRGRLDNHDRVRNPHDFSDGNNATDLPHTAHSGNDVRDRLVAGFSQG